MFHRFTEEGKAKLVGQFTVGKFYSWSTLPRTKETSVLVLPTVLTIDKKIQGIQHCSRCATKLILIHKLINGFDMAIRSTNCELLRF